MGQPKAADQASVDPAGWSNRPIDLLCFVTSHLQGPVFINYWVLPRALFGVKKKKKTGVSPYLTVLFGQQGGIGGWGVGWEDMFSLVLNVKPLVFRGCC